MSTDGHGTNCRRNRLLPKFEDDRQTHRQTTDGRATAYSEREREFTFAKNLT